jgi:hypothetical protein
MKISLVSKIKWIIPLLMLITKIFPLIRLNNGDANVDAYPFELAIPIPALTMSKYMFCRLVIEDI